MYLYILSPSWRHGWLMAKLLSNFIGKSLVPNFLQVMVRDPSALPINRGIMVAKGTSGYIKVYGDKVLPTKRLIRVKPEKRHCLYPDELKYLGRGYLRSNCLFNCYQRFMYNDCKCVPSFYYFLHETGK